MRVHDDFVAVKVPATSANLGPGFDCMGLALDLWDEVSIHATTGPTSVVVEGEGAGNVDLGENNLVVRALRLALDHAGAPQVGVRMRCMNRIPHSRGLGSSASAIVAGLTLARALIGDPDVLGCQEILEIGSELEGHPDNVAPAVYGGATVAWMNEDTKEVGALRLNPPTGVSPVVFIPDFELRTATARAALPENVSHADARFNVARASALAAILSGHAQASGGADLHAVLMEATCDRLHQEQRRGAMDPSLALVDWLRGAGYAAVVSGAGPTVISLEPVGAQIRSDAADSGWRVLPLTVAASGVQITRGSLAKVEF